MENSKLLSIVVPMYNEEECVTPFYNEVTKVLDKTEYNYELIFVDDGSKDKTFELLYALSQKDFKVKIISFSKNFGQQQAEVAGFAQSKGDAVIVMDCDLQDPPSVIPALIEKWNQGFEMVCTKRSTRKKDSLIKRFTSFCYYKTVKRLTGMDVPENSSDFRLMDRKVVNALLSLKESKKSTRSQCAFIGFKQTTVMFDRPERIAGTTKFTLKKMINLAMSGIIPYGHKLLNLPIKLGIFNNILSILGFVALIVLTCLKINFNVVFWLIPTAVFLNSITLLMIGLSNVYLGATYDETKQRPLYIISEKVNCD